MGNSIPKRAFTFLCAKPGEEIYEICITLKDDYGAVSKATNVLSHAHVNLRAALLSSAVDNSGLGYWASFVDLSKAVKGIKQIEEDLRKLDVVQDVKIVRPEPLTCDVVHFPIVNGNSAATVMPAELFGSLFDEIEKILTPSGFAAVFYNAGKKSGGFIAKLFSERYGLKGDDVLLAMVQATKTIGWGEIEDLTIDRRKLTGRFKIQSCFEAVLRGYRKEKICHWTRGFIAGFSSEVVGESLEAVELKCVAAGDKLCEFEVKPKI